MIVYVRRVYDLCTEYCKVSEHISQGPPAVGIFLIPQALHRAEGGVCHQQLKRHGRLGREKAMVPGFWNHFQFLSVAELRGWEFLLFLPGVLEYKIHCSVCVC